MPYEELSAFMAELAAKDCVSARMLETCILTCARTNEIINMKWSQIDLKKATWTLPAEMMKMDRDHIVPLSQPVMTFLQSAHEMRYGDYVFPGRSRGEPMSNMTMLELLADMGHDVTVHGSARRSGPGPTKRRSSLIRRLNSVSRTCPAVMKPRRSTVDAACLPSASKLWMHGHVSRPNRSLRSQASKANRPPKFAKNATRSFLALYPA
jgi:hypothetical protein